MHFELLAAGAVVAGLRFAHPAALEAIGESASGTWLFADEGLLWPHITIRRLADQSITAVYKPKLFCLPGMVEFLRGGTFYWKRVALFTVAYRFDDAEGKALMSTRFGCCRSWLFGARSFRGYVEIQRSAYAMSELALLLMLSWYLVILQQQKEKLQVPP